MGVDRAIVLTAGASERLGIPKALVEVEGQTLVELVCRKLQQANLEVTVVTRASLEGLIQDLLPYVQTVKEVFGIDRLMWGSDWPVCLLAATYKEVMDAALFALGEVSPEEKNRFMFGSAAEFYRLR